LHQNQALERKRKERELKNLVVIITNKVRGIIKTPEIIITRVVRARETVRIITVDKAETARVREDKEIVLQVRVARVETVLEITKEVETVRGKVEASKKEARIIDRGKEQCLWS